MFRCLPQGPEGARSSSGHQIGREPTKNPEEPKENGYPEYGDPEFNRFFLAEILPLGRFAKKTYERGGIMKLSCKFEVIERETSGPVLWLLPNELNGLTLMRPSDY